MRGSGCQTPASSLKEKRSEIARDELVDSVSRVGESRRGGQSVTYNSGVRFRTNPGVLRTKCVHDPPQAQIDTTCHERRRDSQADDLDQEAVLRPLVVPALDPPHIADDLEGDP